LCEQIKTVLKKLVLHTNSVRGVDKVRKKKIFIIIIASIFVLSLICYFIYMQVEITSEKNQITEYTPEAEITR
jgi:flagellar basal body-associated protein FliL